MGVGTMRDIKKNPLFAEIPRHFRLAFVTGVAKDLYMKKNPLFQKMNFTTLFLFLLQ